ncbi:Grx4 family monothiol glutaredoxin [Gammaproteobacteria bacterium]|nr:Grx4 family monothiol glutaredoxin [Gammaproteobacteria bacterium]
MSTNEIIKNYIENNDVVLFMKGTPTFPQCGFSSNAVNLLKANGANDIFTINVLEDNEIRQGIKDFSNWPTIPQLYIKGEFVGGSDIITEMHEAGELKELVQSIIS